MNSTVGGALPPDVINWLSGLAGGTAQVIVGHPFDTIKVRLQTSSNYAGPIDCLKKTVFGLYKGVTSPLIGIGLCNAVLFSANGVFRQVLRNEEGDSQLSLSRIAMAGTMAGGVMAFFNCPIELLKVRLQVQDVSRTKMYRNIFDCGWKTFTADGLAGLYRGIGMTLLRDLPSFAGYFLFYEGAKRAVSNWDAKPESALHPVELMLCGGFAGFGAWLPAYPQDVLKSRIQSSPTPLSIRQAFDQLVLESGLLRGLFRGFAPTMARAFPANAATFMAYEATLSYLQSK